MSIVKKDTTVKTEGVSPKVAWPTVSLIALGVVLCVLDKAGAIDTPDELWLALIGSGLGTGAIGSSAPPALQTRKHAHPPEHDR
jgi:hypothetical protein